MIIYNVLANVLLKEDIFSKLMNLFSESWKPDYLLNTLKGCFKTVIILKYANIEFSTHFQLYLLTYLLLGMKENFFRDKYIIVDVLCLFSDPARL